MIPDAGGPGRKLYLAGLKSSREGPTMSELEHFDGRCKKDTQSRQLLGVDGGSGL
jgi:hypothetical protein